MLLKVDFGYFFCHPRTVWTVKDHVAHVDGCAAKLATWLGGVWGS